MTEHLKNPDFTPLALEILKGTRYFKPNLAAYLPRKD